MSLFGRVSKYLAEQGNQWRRQAMPLFPLVLLLFAMPLTVLAQQNITGEIVSGSPLEGVAVQFLDPFNVVVVSTSTTDGTGFYDSGILSIGNYKVRFSKSGWEPEYFGAGKLDSFDLGALVAVQVGSTAVASESLLPAFPSEIIPHSCALFGTVTDAGSGAPITGVQVNILDAFNAMPIATPMTDATGSYYVSHKDVGPLCAPVKVRFSDPAAVYLPQYFGAAGQDVFALATSVDWADNQVDVSVAIVKLTPSGAIDEVSDEITDSSLPPNAKTRIIDQLNRAKAIISDGNPNNDAAACGVLSSIINEINAMQNRGELSAFEADILRQSAKTARNTIGCR